MFCSRFYLLLFPFPWTVRLLFPRLLTRFGSVHFLSLLVTCVLFGSVCPCPNMPQEEFGTRLGTRIKGLALSYLCWLVTGQLRKILFCTSFRIAALTRLSFRREATASLTVCYVLRSAFAGVSFFPSGVGGFRAKFRPNVPLRCALPSDES